MECVRGGIENCIAQLSGAAVPTNNASFQEGADYVHPARTAEEIKADIAALHQSKSTFGEAFSEEAEEQTDLFAKLSRTIGAAEEIPNGTPNQSPANKPDNSGPLSWVW